MPRHDITLIYLTTLPAIIGIVANLLVLYLTIFKTPSAFQTYSRILLAAALCDLIGSCMLPALIPQSLMFNEANVLKYHGLCTMLSVEACWVGTGVIEMMITVNDAFICVSFYFRMNVIRGNQPSGKRTLLTLCVDLLLHSSLCVGYIEMHRKAQNIEISTSDSLLAEELRGKTFCGIIKFSDPLTLAVIIWSLLSSGFFFWSAMILRWKTIRELKYAESSMSPITRQSHIMLIRALNVQLLILICFLTGSLLYMSMIQGISKASVLIQFAIVPVCGLQFTLSPIANIIFIKPYRSVFKCCTTPLVASSPFSSANN